MYKKYLVITLINLCLFLLFFLGLYIDINNTHQHFKENNVVTNYNCPPLVAPKKNTIYRTDLEVLSESNKKLLKENKAVFDVWEDNGTPLSTDQSKTEKEILDQIICLNGAEVGVTGLSPSDIITIKDASFRYGTFRLSRFAWLYFENCDFSNTYFDRCSLSQCTFKKCNFKNAVFEDADTLAFCYFDSCNFTQSRFMSYLQPSSWFYFMNSNMLYTWFYPRGLDNCNLFWEGNHNQFWMALNDDYGEPPLLKKLKEKKLDGDVKYLEAKLEIIRTHKMKYGDWYLRHYLAGNFLNEYRTNPLKPLFPVLMLFPVFYFIYLVYSYNNKIFLTWKTSLKSRSKSPDSITYSLNRITKNNVASRFSLILFFTLQSSFSFGFSWKAISMASLFKLIQTRDVEFKQEGSIRWIIALHSIIFYYCLIMSGRAII